MLYGNKNKAIALLASVLLTFLSVCTLPASAVDMSGPVGEVNVSFGTPKADGKIEDGEYSAKVTLDGRNMKAVTSISYNVPETHSIDLYFSWDESFLYVAMNVTDPTRAPSDVDENGNWLFNGDNAQFFADFGPTLAYRELSDTGTLGGRRSSLFAAGINSDDSCFLLHQLSKNDSIMNLAPDAPPAEGKLTETGWIFEYAIPFSVLLADMTDKTGVELTQANVGNGAKINCMLIYNDYEKAGTLKNMFGTTSTGYEDPFDWQPEVFGIYLTLTGGEKAAEPVPSPGDESTESSSDINSETPTDTETESAGRTSGTAATEPETDSGAVTSGAAGNNDGNGIVIAVVSAVVVCAAAAVIIIVIRKKKQTK